MHHGQTRGRNEKHLKYVKHVNFTKTEREVWKSGGNNNFREIGEKFTETAKIGGKFKICSR